MIAVLGSVNMDLVLEAERIPRPGETVAAGDAFNGALAWALQERPLAEATAMPSPLGPSPRRGRERARPSHPSPNSSPSSGRGASRPDQLRFVVYRKGSGR